MFDQFFINLNGFAEASLGEPFFALPLYILAGLASSLFPCVYPLIPITVGFLQNRAQKNQSRFFHPLLYWAGTIFAYTLLGGIAALSGGAFNTWLRNGFVILGFGFLFMYLSFVTMDWVHLNFNTGDRLMHKAAGKSGNFFTVAMGFAAGFIASACVAPALVTMLLFIAKYSAGSSGSAYAAKILYGAALSTSFGIGIGVPFFLAGVLGAKLPKAGTWMQFIKYTFALLIGFYALLELQKGFLVLGVSTMDSYLILAGFGLIFLSVLMGLKPPEAQDLKQKTRFYFALITLALAFALIIRGLNPINISAQTQKQQDQTSLMKNDPLYGKYEMIGDLKFYRSNNEALKTAQVENKPVFIDFYADWCSNCKDFSRLIQKDKAIHDALTKVVLLKIYDTDPIFESYENNPKYSELLIGLPFFLILTPQGNFSWKDNNYRNTKGMIQALKIAAK